MRRDSQKSAIQIQEEFDGDVKHINGNMFRVRREIINFAKAGISSIDGKLIYGNPRWFINKDGKPEAKGIDKSKMEELKSSIQDRGVDHPIRLRVSEDSNGELFLEVVNGERRLRAIGELCEDDKKCHDSISNEKKPAEEVYEWVECRIEHMDDATALVCALQLNETSEIIGDTANINVVRVLRESGYDDSEILKATGKSLSWLREMDQLIGLDEICLKHYQSETINKQVALRLALIKDVEERVAHLEKIKRVAEERHTEMVRQSRQKVERAMEEAQGAELEDFESDIDEIGDGAKSRKKSSKTEKARKKVKKAKEELDEVSSKKPVAKSKDADKASGSSKPLSHAKISSKLLKPLQEIIGNDGSSDDGDFEMQSLLLIQAILEAILSGNHDIMTILEEHCSVQGAIDESDEDEDSEMEASDESDEDEDENSYIEASDESDEDEDSEIEASDESEEDEDEDSYVEDSDEGQEEMVADLEREFEEELRSMDRDY